MKFPLVLMAVLLVVGLMQLRQRRSTAKNEVWRLVHSGGLPKDERSMAAAEDRLAQRQVAVVAGPLGAALVGGAILLAVGPDASSPMLGWAVVVAVVGVGVGIGISVLHFRAVRAARPAGPRTAALRQRRLGDYLTRLEVVGQYVSLVFPLLALALGVLVLVTADDHQGRGWVLVVPALVAIPLAVVGLSLQRQILELNQPASGEADLRWQEALRAKALRDMGNILVGFGWLCGSAGALWFAWPAGVPAFTASLAWAMFAAATALVLLTWSAGDSKWGLKRSQTAIRPGLGGERS